MERGKNVNEQNLNLAPEKPDKEADILNLLRAIKSAEAEKNALEKAPTSIELEGTKKRISAILAEIKRRDFNSFLNDQISSGNFNIMNNNEPVPFKEPLDKNSAPSPKKPPSDIDLSSIISSNYSENSPKK